MRVRGECNSACKAVDTGQFDIVAGRAAGGHCSRVWICTNGEIRDWFDHVERKYDGVVRTKISGYCYVVDSRWNRVGHVES